MLYSFVVNELLTKESTDQGNMSDSGVQARFDGRRVLRLLNRAQSVWTNLS
jgi:hypothetical protein